MTLPHARPPGAMAAERRRRRRRRGAFTLVELLVVTGVVALPISILLPALNKARAAGLQVSCLSNLRQLGLAMQMYVNEDKGGAGGCRLGNGNAAAGIANVTWDDLLATHTGRKLTEAEMANFYAPPRSGDKLYACPADPIEAAAPAPGVTANRRSYGMVRGNGAGTGVSPTDGAAANNWGVTGKAAVVGQPWSAQLGRVRESFNTLVLTEVPTNPYLGVNTASMIDTPNDQVSPPPGAWSPPPHAQRANYLFAGWHAENRRPRDTVSRAPGSSLTTPRGPWTRVTGD